MGCCGMCLESASVWKAARSVSSAGQSGGGGRGAVPLSKMRFNKVMDGGDIGEHPLIQL